MSQSRRELHPLFFLTLVAFALFASATWVQSAPTKPARYYLPGAQASKIVTVSNNGNAQAEVIVMTEPVAVKETGPKETIKRFGEVYDYAPSFIALHMGVPTM